MSDTPKMTDELVQRAADGDEAALAELFASYRGRLQQVIRLRLDREASRASRCLRHPSGGVHRPGPEAPRLRASLLCPFSSGSGWWWGSGCCGCIVSILGRRCATRAARSRSIKRTSAGEAQPRSRPSCSGGSRRPVRRLLRVEQQLLLQEALNRMDPIDREVIALRHFEELE